MLKLIGISQQSQGVVCECILPCELNCSEDYTSQNIMKNSPWTMLCYILWDEHKNGERVWWGGLHSISWKPLQFKILKMKSCASALDWIWSFLLLSTFEMKIFKVFETEVLELFIVCKQKEQMLKYRCPGLETWNLVDVRLACSLSYRDGKWGVKCLLKYVFIYTSHCWTGQRRLYSSGEAIAS